MKQALLHYWLTNMRGGEKVLAALAEMLPDSDIFTHAFAEPMRDGSSKEPFWHGHRVTESFIARLPWGRKKPQAYLPLMPLASRRLDLSAYDLVISSESGPIKGIVRRPGQKHVCYCHTPMRYVWDMYDDYYAAAGLAGRAAMKLWTGYLRHEDLRSAESVDVFVANSRFVSERIRRIYGRESIVVNPPVEVDFFRGEYPKEDYYLIAGELVSYKRADIALEACVKMGRRAVVVGNGKLRARLEQLYAGNPSVSFLGRIGDEELKNAYGRARALIFPGVEDFGIVPVEAQAAGTPVIAYGMGGALETVSPGETGLFFRKQTVESICEAIEEFESREWSAESCRAAARRFGHNRFKAEMSAVLNLKQ